MPDWSADTRRLLRAYLRAIALAEPLQRELARRYGVALADMHALRVLRDMGCTPISRFGAVLSLKPSSATNLVDRLESAGLVERVPDGTDRRVTGVRVTPLGEGALDDRSLFESSGLVARVERFEPADRRQLAGLLERMLEAMPEEVATEHEAPAPAPAPRDEAVATAGRGGAA